MMKKMTMMKMAIITKRRKTELITEGKRMREITIFNFLYGKIRIING